VCSPSQDPIESSIQASFSTIAPHSTLMYALPIRRVRDVLGQLVPSASLESVHEIPSTRLARLYTLNLSGPRQLLLSFSPSLAVRLLRHEQTLLLSEAALVYFLNDLASSAAIPSSSLEQAGEDPSLAWLIPRMLRHSSNTREIGYPYTIFEHPIGSPLSSQSIYLTLPERRHIDGQIGKLVRELALITSPSRTFGAALRVYGDPFTQTAGQAPLSSSSASDAGGRGSATWTSAFNSSVEGILRDGEDMSVLLPYDVIRRHFSRLSWRLEAVITPRLVVLDVGCETNVMIERRLEDGPLPPQDSVKITGLRDWSQGIFGDPLMAGCFEDPSEAFLAAWSAGYDESLIEGQDGAETRMLLYRCYRALVDVVTEYYRPRPDSSRKELDARRRLTAVLTDLEKADLEQSETPKRSRRSSVAGEDMIVTKKIKMENEDV